MLLRTGLGDGDELVGEKAGTQSPDGVGGAVEEVVRYEPITPFTARIATEDVELRDVTVPKGTVLFVCSATANRDPATFDDPDRFDITREPEPVLTFGFGAHYCIGANLARAELQETGRLGVGLPADVVTNRYWHARLGTIARGGASMDDQEETGWVALTARFAVVFIFLVAYKLMEWLNFIATEIHKGFGPLWNPKNPDAVKFDSLTYGEVLERRLKVADATAISLCMDNRLPIVVFDLMTEGNIARAVRGEKIGTLVSDGEGNK